MSGGIETRESVFYSYYGFWTLHFLKQKTEKPKEPLQFALCHKAMHWQMANENPVRSLGFRATNLLTNVFFES